jgi:hypothetical protein
MATVAVDGGEQVSDDAIDAGVPTARHAADITVTERTAPQAQSI